MSDPVAARPRPPLESPSEIMERLVSFPTVSHQSNLPLVDWVENWLAAHGIESLRLPDETGTKASLVAHVGPRQDGGVILSGHTDVVPVEGQNWTSDPFTVTERDGRLYGRGTCDMKGFDALALWAMAEAARRGLARPLQIALTRDEEIGCLGAPPLLEYMAAQGFPKAGAAIIGEPSMMTCVTGHKGGKRYMFHVRGHEVHSSILHTGVSAIMEAVKIIDWGNRRNAASAAATPDPVAAMFDPPWTTVHSGKISGGTAHNITAANCTFGLEIRCVPSDSLQDWIGDLMARVAEVDAGMKAIHPEAGITWTESFAVNGLRPEQEGAAEALVRSLTGDNGNHVVSYGTEAGQFQEAGYSAVVCGPGDIAQAHQPDEYIEIAQMEAGQDFMRKLLDRLAE